MDARGGVVGEHLEQPGHLGGADGEQIGARQRGRQAAGEGEQQVVAALEVCALVGQDRAEVVVLEHGEDTAADDDRMGFARNAIRGRLIDLEDDGVEVGMVAAGQAGHAGVLEGVAAQAQQGGAEAEGDENGCDGGESRQRQQSDLERAAVVADGGVVQVQ
nr:hypothetical protein [Nocardia seriolae]